MIASKTLASTIMLRFLTFPTYLMKRYRWNWREDFWQHKVMEIYNKAHSPTVIPTNMAPKI